MGWYIEKADGHRDSGVFELYTERDGSKPFKDGQRFAALKAFLRDTFVAHNVGLVAFEDVPSMTRGRQSPLYFGYRATVMSWCYEWSIPVVPLAVNTVKRTMGEGRMDKDAMIAAVQMLGYLPWDDNEADAIATLLTLYRVSDMQAQTEQLRLDSEQTKAHKGSTSHKTKARESAMRKTPTTKKTTKPKLAKKPATKRARKAA